LFSKNEEKKHEIYNAVKICTQTTMIETNVWG